ncbi:efflux RND transporter periplasmic adaptor subunit [Marinilabilia rubra]|uniref:RND transporter n=1 Tax=Marinilabilia rubra TaxID=2162893 RepID=A0A2U2B387_9BACT|nr:HlyD family secretion protein [Marinilabilia rubra]PWD97522.1 RND transporter [Marinilabilia rubra]
MKQRLLILIPLAFVILAFLGYRFFLSDDVDEANLVKVEKGKFELYVVSMGELEAHESKDILIPDVLLDRTIRIRHIGINDLVREGKEVEKGDYVATLDPSEVEENIKNSRETLDMLSANLENSRMDSSLNLSDARDAIRQARDNVLDKEVKVEQSIYESKAVQRQVQIELEMAERSLEQKKRNYQQKKRKNEIRVKRIEDKITQEEEHMQVLLQLKQDLIVKAPAQGVVVYARDWGGDKIKVGSRVSRWNPRIAILPDLSTIMSVTYVKEIDVTKIHEGMPVKINIDAFPGEVFDGVVKNVANIGKEIEGQFLNGFKVDVEVDPHGVDLLPGMTSTNRFIIESMEDQLMVPREAVFVEDSREIVYKKTPLGVVREEVETAGENEKHVRITEGVKAGDKVFLTPPQ